MRLIYSLAWWLGMPLVLWRLWRRGRDEPGYRANIGERLGFYQPAPAISMPRLWLHAVSVGETRAAQPLVEALLERYPDHGILLTHMTPTGRATGRALFEQYGDRVMQSYFPYDTGWMAKRFLRHFSPRLCVLMETEVWPNMTRQCARHGVPVALVNARLSERSLKKGRRAQSLIRPAVDAVSVVAAQTEADAQRLRAFGAAKVDVTGSIKFDVTPPPSMLVAGMSLRSRIGGRSVLVCASTREGEEALILDAFADLEERPLLVIVPRHPQRFDAVAELIAARSLRVQKRSTLAQNGLVSPATDVLLGDTMGELFAWYAAADVAFIGGSLLPLGGQNLIEACAVGTPVLIGPHTFNFSDISNDAVADGAALRVEDAAAMIDAARRLLADDMRRSRMVDAASAFAERHRGATARTLTLLTPLIDTDMH